MKQIKIYGLGGQGVVTAAKVLCKAVAIFENAHAQAIPAYGHERRGAPVYADAVISNDPIKMKGFVYAPDYVVLFDDSVIAKGIDVMAGASPSTVFIVNTGKPKENYPFRNHPMHLVDAQSVALNAIGRDIPNTAMLGALAGAGLVSMQAIQKAIQSEFPADAEDNIKAAQIASRLVTRHHDRPSIKSPLRRQSESEQSAEQNPNRKKTKDAYGPCALVFCSTATGTWRIQRPRINDAECVYCGTCETSCPTGVVTIHKNESSAAKKPTGTVNIDMTYCKGCGICSDQCPKNAISMIDERKALP